MKKSLWLIAYTLASAILIATIWVMPFTLLWQAIFTGAVALTLVGLYLASLKFTRFYKALVICFIIEIVVLYGYIALYYSGLLEHFSSIETAREWFSSFGIYAWLVFFIIQLLQVIILPIPAQVTTIAGILLLGAWTTFIISSVATIVGSLICFGLGKWLGVPIAYKIASKETVDKYRKLLSEKGRVLLPIMFLLPFFPDDLLCFIAGTTTMSWSFYSIITFTCRIIGIACICLFGSGELIPFSGWGIPVWIVLAIILLTACILVLKYQKQIEEYIIGIFTKKKNKKNVVKTEENNSNAENLEK